MQKPQTPDLNTTATATATATATVLPDPPPPLLAEVPRGYWQDAKGGLIPEARVKAVDKARDKLVRARFKKAQALSTQMAQFKEESMAEIADFLEASANEWGVTMRGARGKGNLSLTTFDGELKIERTVQDSVVFDEALQIAKVKASNCIQRWSKGSNLNLQALVNDAFDVDKAGNINVARVLALRRHDIDDEEWKQAMQLVANSMKTVASKMQLRFYKRDDKGQYQPVALNMSAL